MQGGDSNPEYDSREARQFRTTHWSIVLEAGLAEDARSAEALERLCHAYWPPLYTYVRRMGYSEAEAQDLTQEFFHRLLRRKDIAKANRAAGRFRSFLLSALKHFLHDEWDKARAQKRGGRVEFITFDDAAQFSDSQQPAAAGLDPAQEYERRWAYSVLTQAWNLLRTEYASRRQVEIFDAVRPRLAGLAKSEPLVQAAARLGITEEALKTAERRLRERFPQAVRQVVQQTVTNASELDDELRHLQRIFAGG